MRVRSSKNGITVKAYAGTTGILLAFNRDIKKPEKDFLGFSIERIGPSGDKEWIGGMLPFAHMNDHEAGTLIPSNIAPLQKFRWSDYSVNPDTAYTYIVYAAQGDPKSPNLLRGPTIKVKTASISGGKHRILFNRAAAASQAFSRKFRTISDKLDKAKKGKKSQVAFSPEAWVWLSRGVKEAIIEQIEKAKDQNWNLDIAIYEYEQQDIVDAVDAAYARGANVRIIYHAKNGDSQTAQNEKNLKKLSLKVKRRRVTSSIFHDKYIVLSKNKNGKKVLDSVLTGSTNFTDNGVYRQANVVHITTDSDIATAYQIHFDELWTELGNGQGVAETRAFINNDNPIEEKPGVFVGFSPRSGFGDIAEFVNKIGGAESDVLFCTAFNLHKDVQCALEGEAHDPILRFGVQNKASSITGYHADKTAQFVAANYLKSGLDGFLKESLEGTGVGSILIHTKIVIVDFTSEQPVVISGSHNLSGAASSSNDENFMIIAGDTDIADSYGVEILRIYDHYRFRYWSQKLNSRSVLGAEQPRRMLLKPNGSWAKKYFMKGTLAFADRVRFSG